MCIVPSSVYRSGAAAVCRSRARARARWRSGLRVHLRPLPFAFLRLLARVCVCERRICVYMRVLSCCDLDFERSAKRISESFAKEKLFIVRRVEHSLGRRCKFYLLKIDFTASFTGKIGVPKNAFDRLPSREHAARA